MTKTVLRVPLSFTTTLRPPASPPPARPAVWPLWLFGVALPLATIFLELAGHFCSTVLFEPFPRSWHVWVALTVPAANAAGAWALGRGARLTASAWTWLAYAVGFGLAVAVWYAIPFVPVWPLALVGVLFGVGILPSVPALALWQAFRLRRTMRITGLRLRFWPGAVAGFAALVALALPALLVRVGASWANADKAATRSAGLELLRRAGSERELLRLCHFRPHGLLEPLGAFLGADLSPEQAQALYYRVTGASFDSQPAPFRPGFFHWDQHLGGAAVGNRQEGLRLASARMDGSLDGRASLGYLEWTLTFRNDSPGQREARAEVQLPQGGVVSRATLWVDGEEREAAFAGRAQVREAYQQVVRVRHDPLLVTESGPDRILVQCFPVLPGGEMKIKVGITAPLSGGGLVLPYLLDSNFAAGKTSVVLASPDPLHGTGLMAGQKGPEYVLEGALPPAPVWIRSEARTEPAWTPDPGAAGYAIRQDWERLQVERPRRLIVVVDGSRDVGAAAGEIAEALGRLPSDIGRRLLVASETVKMPDRLGSVKFVGGADSVPALEQAIRRAGQEENTVVLWIYGRQPVLLKPVDGLLQICERTRKPVPLYALGAGCSANEVLGKLYTAPGLKIAERRAGLGEDLAALFDSWKHPQVRAVRTRVAGDAFPERRTSAHLARLWAAGEVDRLRKAGQGEDAVALAAAYRIVTRVSGAVVLENRQQFQAAGLQPAAKGTVPTVPEPATWVLVLAGVMVLVPVLRRRWA